MSDKTVQEFYEELGFEEIETEEQATAFYYEKIPGGIYALVTDEEGGLPQTLRQRIIFAAYSPEDAYSWSVEFKNSYLFQELWVQAQNSEDKFAVVQAQLSTD
jgi:hypothetical protein